MKIKIDHIAIWVKDLEMMRRFYEKYFGAKVGSLYHNPTKQFHSYFLSFNSGCRLELMQRPDIPANKNIVEHENLGLIHFAISIESKQEVERLTAQLESDGFKVIGQPRTTGDGYYESVVLDPENNRIEITI